MPKPSFLDTPFAMFLRSGVMDVAQIIADINTLLPTMGWTQINAESGHWKSPATPAGRLVEVTFSSVAQGDLRLETKNAFGVSNGYRRMLITTTGVGSVVRIFYGAKYVYVDCQTTTENVGAWILDPSPMSDGDCMYMHMTMAGTRDGASGGAVSYGGCIYWAGWMPGSGTFYYNLWSYLPTYQAKGGGISSRLVGPGGDFLFFPVEVLGAQGANGAYYGRIPQALYGHDSIFNKYVNVLAPLGDGTVGTFMAVGRTSQNWMQLFIRIA